jgi:D-alanyl-D-alanine endopeptidase (penicillin-binding protein 7)
LIETMAVKPPRARPPARTARLAKFAALALAALSMPFVSGLPAVAAQAPGASTGDGPPRYSRTAPSARAAAARPSPSKLPATRESQLQQLVKSKIALVVDANTSQPLVAKDAERVVPIASITKLMTAMVVLDVNPPMGEKLKVGSDDRDLLMGTSSRLRIGTTLSREDMLHLALMASENRAAAALSRYYPGGRPAFIKAMNAKAAALGMAKTHFVNPNGLTNENVSTAFDLVKLVRAAGQYPLIREFTTDPRYDIRIGRYTLPFVNSNRLVGRPGWDIDIQKTGFTNEAGRCVVMRVNADGRSLIMIFLDGFGKLTRYADARRVLMRLALAEKK